MIRMHSYTRDLIFLTLQKLRCFTLFIAGGDGISDFITEFFRDSLLESTFIGFLRQRTFRNLGYVNFFAYGNDVDVLVNIAVADLCVRKIDTFDILDVIRRLERVDISVCQKQRRGDLKIPEGRSLIKAVACVPHRLGGVANAEIGRRCHCRDENNGNPRKKVLFYVSRCVLNLCFFHNEPLSRLTRSNLQREAGAYFSLWKRSCRCALLQHGPPSWRSQRYA